VTMSSSCSAIAMFCGLTDCCAWNPPPNMDILCIDKWKNHSTQQPTQLFWDAKFCDSFFHSVFDWKGCGHVEGPPLPTDNVYSRASHYRQKYYLSDLLFIAFILFQLLLSYTLLLWCMESLGATLGYHVYDWAAFLFNYSWLAGWRNLQI
jgi:hypothetical protein